MYTKFFIFIFLLNTIVSPLNSKERYSLNIPDKMQIELKNKDYNRYMKMGMRAYADGSDSKLSNIKKKYKKWIEADIVLDSKKNKSVKAKVRIMGDWKDHLRLPFTSLKVKILDDDYYGVRRFNLFLPHTRKGINEVYWTLLLKYIGFPSFYTKMVDVNLNGLKYEAIFQEDASKEFLERNSFRETVIIKDNDFDFYLNKKSKKLYGKLFSHSIIIDNGNFLKDLNNKVATSIASEAIALHSAKDFEDRILNWDLYYKINIKYALHGQDKVNRKFIFIPHKKAFIPLYYDGMVQFPIGKTECKSKSNSKIFENFSDDYKKLSKEDLSPMKKCVFHEIYSLYEKQKKNKSNIKKYKTNVNYEFIPKYTKIKNKILNYLENNNVVKKIEKKGMLYSFLKDNKYYLCELNIEEEVINSCQHLSHKEYNDLITKSGKFSTFKNYKFFPINLGSFDKSLEIIKLLDDPLLQEQTFIFDKSNLYALDLNTKNEKKYNLVFNNHNAKLIITGDILNNKFNIKGNTSIPAKNYQGLIITYLQDV